MIMLHVELIGAGSALLAELVIFEYSLLGGHKAGPGVPETVPTETVYESEAGTAMELTTTKFGSEEENEPHTPVQAQKVIITRRTNAASNYA